MFIDIGKFGLLAVLLAGVYFGFNPWWVPAVMLAWMYQVYVLLPFTKKRLQAAYQKQYLDALAGRNGAEKPEDLN